MTESKKNQVENCLWAGSYLLLVESVRRPIRTVTFSFDEGERKQKIELVVTHLFNDEHARQSTSLIQC